VEIADLGEEEGCGGGRVSGPRRPAGGGYRDQAGGVVTEKGAAGAGFGKNLAEVGVAGLVLDVEEDGSGERRAAVGCRGDLGPEDGLDPGFPGGEKEFDRGVEIGIGEADGREA